VKLNADGLLFVVASKPPPFAPVICILSINEVKAIVELKGWPIKR
jgi:hypothetical protein